MSIDFKVVLAEALVAGKYEDALKEFKDRGILKYINKYRVLRGRALKLASDLKSSGVDVSRFLEALASIGSKAHSSASKIGEKL